MISEPSPASTEAPTAVNADDKAPVVLVMGPSGAGRATAISALEDLGFEAIDNMPLSLIPRLLDGPPVSRRMALGLDVRNRDFSVDAVFALMERIQCELIYLDAREDVLVQRYSETRRRHPLAPQDAPLLGIRAEVILLAPIRARADYVFDTSTLTSQALTTALSRSFAARAAANLSITVQSFAYKRGLPQGVDLVFDCRFLRNPHWEPALREHTGLDVVVQNYVVADPLFEPFFDHLTGMLLTLFPAFKASGKTHLTVALGCTGGQHRSAAVAQKLAKALAQQGWEMSVRHRELDRQRSNSQHLKGTST
jgi:UPF0042 nucleotide-binding protein